MDRHNHHHHHNNLKTRDNQEEAVVAPSNSSSPNHEFSFTISLHSVHDAKNRHNNNPSSIAVDLSPADDIFFHGHLLPLHLLSHLPPVSPRSSTNSIESFPLPIAEPVTEQTEQSRNRGSLKPPKSFSQLFAKWRRGSEANQEANKQKSNLRAEVSHLIKRYVRMVRPLMLFRNRKRNSENVPFRSQPPYSFSGNLSDLRSSNNNNKQEMMMMRRGRRREMFSSAPASMRTSPSNSGLLVATAKTLPSSASSDSTMEELQAAIQAAIAHCKNSIAVEEKLKC